MTRTVSRVRKEPWGNILHAMGDTQAAADEVTRARQHVEGRLAACGALAARLRFLKRAVVVARYRYVGGDRGVVVGEEWERRRKS